MKKNKTITFKRAFLVFFSMFLFQYTFAQDEINISGTVKDTEGVPLAGANVLVVDSNIGASTDFDGNFTLSGVPSNANLSISYIGYITQTVSVDGNTTINVVLQIDNNSLDEIVVIGYQSVRRSDLTGATSVIDQKVPIKTSQIHWQNHYRV